MPLTAAQRAEINRQNARNSTGPTSVEGKAASRRNATKHGLRAEVLSLPDEDPAIAAARSDAWNDYYQPQSPGAQHLVNDCVAATLLSERCQTFHAAALSRQIRNAQRDWDTQREDSVETLALLIQTDPAAAVHRLKQSAHGLRWMIQGWEGLEIALKERGKWTLPERDLAIRLQGLRPEPEHIRTSPPAWVTRYLSLFCYNNPSEPAVALLFEDRNLPDLYRPTIQADARPGREDCQRMLGKLIARELEQLRSQHALLHAFDQPDRAEAGDRALILQDPDSARLFLRYQSEARSAFHRSYAALIKALERDAAEEPDSHPSATSPNDPCPAPDTATEPESPNEADSDANPDEGNGCDPTPEPEPRLVMVSLPTNASPEPSPPVPTAPQRPAPMRLV